MLSPILQTVVRERGPKDVRPRTKGIIRIALVLEGYPEKKLGEGEVSEIRRLVRGRILELPEDTLLIFTSTWERDGAVIVNSNEQLDWLKS